MYVKLFKSLFEGSMRGKSDMLLVWVNLLAHADREGFIDRHFGAIKDETGLSLERVRAAILELESPDPDSRSKELEGRRLERIDEHRDWGWRIVNYEHYRNIKDTEERRLQNRLAQEKFRAKGVSNVSDSKPLVSTPAYVSQNKPMQRQMQKKQQQEGEDTKEGERKAVVVLPSAEGGEEKKNREALIRIGISPAKAVSLVNDFTPERIQAVLKALSESNAKNPTGWVIFALEDNWDLAKVLKQPKDMGASNVLPSEAEVKRRRQDEKETFAKVQKEQEARQAAIKNIPPDEWEKAKELAQKALKEEFPHLTSSSLSQNLIEHKALELVGLTREAVK